VLGCQILLSSDSHLRNADRGSLALLLQSCDVPYPVVCGPALRCPATAARRRYSQSVSGEKSLAVNCRDSGKRPAMRSCPYPRRPCKTTTARIRAPRDRGRPKLACGLLRAAAGWPFTSPRHTCFYHPPAGAWT
jgi:hypothetical protein